jgi:hypothetical protein
LPPYLLLLSPPFPLSFARSFVLPALAWIEAGTAAPKLAATLVSVATGTGSVTAGGGVTTGAAVVVVGAGAEELFFSESLFFASPLPC